MSITSARKSSYALKAVGAMPVVPTWPPAQGYFEKQYEIYAPLEIDGRPMPICKVWMPVVLWNDPEWPQDDGWRARVAGFDCSIHLLWPECGGRPIGKATFDEMMKEMK